jgi:hypothetical protein
MYVLLTLFRCPGFIGSFSSPLAASAPTWLWLIGVGSLARHGMRQRFTGCRRSGVAITVNFETTFCRRLRTSPPFDLHLLLLFVFVFFLPSEPFSLESLRPSSYTDGLLLESFHSQKARSLSLLAHDWADARHTVTLVSVARCLSPPHTMSSSIAIPAGPSATTSCHKGTGSSANSLYSTSPSWSPPSAGKDKALHARRLSLLSWLKPDPPPTRRDCSRNAVIAPTDRLCRHC